MATTTRLGPSPMDLSVFAKDAVCHVCWYQTNKGAGKGQESKTGQGKATKAKDGDTKTKGACQNCNEVGHFARDCPKKKETSNASSSGGGDVHCLPYTDDQFQWIMMPADSGTIKHRVVGGFWSCMSCVAVQSETWFIQGRDVFDCHQCAS